jgi:gluconolactonase
VIADYKGEIMTIQVFEPEMQKLIDPAAEATCLANGFMFTEGPVWDRRQGCVYFSDIPANTLYRYSKADGVSIKRKPSNNSNGMTLDAQGRLVVCEHRTRRVTRETAGVIETVAERYQGKRLNSPNDIIVASDGSILFSDPHYGLLDGLGGPAAQELPFRGVYRLAPGASEPTLLAGDFQAPNGLALSPDERSLYVDDTIGHHLRVFEVGDGWNLKNGRVLFDFPRGVHEGVPDGLKLDSAGNIYCTGPFGVWVIAPSGTALGRIDVPEVTANLNWGEQDGRTLFLTASTGLYQIRTLAQGKYIGG